MKPLVVNRHRLDWTVGPDGEYVPCAPNERALLTRTYAGGLATWSASSFPDVVVTDMTKPAQLEGICDWMIRSRALTHIVSIHEKDVLMAARLRERHHLARPIPEQVIPYRDKLLMARHVAAAGLPCPQVAELTEGPYTVPWSGRTVVKSRWGLGASEVVVVDEPEEIADAVRRLGGRPEELLAQEYIAGTMAHVDSVVHDRRVLFASASRYLQQPGHFEREIYQGSVILTDGALREELLDLNARVLHALGLHNCVTHAEFFVTNRGLLLCEVAARPGGGGIDEIVRSAYGVDLVRAAVRMQCGLDPKISGAERPSNHALSTHAVVGIFQNVTDLDLTHELQGLSGLRSYRRLVADIPGPVRHATDYGHIAFLEGSDAEQVYRSVEQLLTIVETHATTRSVTP